MNEEKPEINWFGLGMAIGMFLGFVVGFGRLAGIFQQPAILVAACLLSVLAVLVAQRHGAPLDEFLFGMLIGALLALGAVSLLGSWLAVPMPVEPPTGIFIFMLFCV